jgi:phenylpyruvate tautomerase PptA (4-oxalocrotonate tautomerase family)
MRSSLAKRVGIFHTGQHPAKTAAINVNHTERTTMPIIHVNLHRGTSPEHRQAIANSIQSAMIEVMRIPEDDYFQVTNEYDRGNIHFDRNYFGIPRGENPVLIELRFNTRPAEDKGALFEAIARNLTRNPGIKVEDIYMNIVECAPPNWWAHARTIDAQTGTDSRMSR